MIEYRLRQWSEASQRKLYSQVLTAIEQQVSHFSASHKIATQILFCPAAPPLGLCTSLPPLLALVLRAQGSNEAHLAEPGGELIKTRGGPRFIAFLTSLSQLQLENKSIVIFPVKQLPVPVGWNSKMGALPGAVV